MSASLVRSCTNVLLVSLITLLGGLTVGPASQVAAAPGALTWSDEFSGPAGSKPDGSKWRYDIGGGGWGNGELQYYTDSVRNASLDGAGHLVITARRDDAAAYQCNYGPCEYTSARLLTAEKFTQKYGRFTARIKIPGGEGVWPAFWMLNANLFHGVPWPNGGEIDVFENIGREPSTIWGSLHGPGYSGGNALHASFTLPGGQSFASAYHTFTVDWGPDSITWYVDGVAYEHRSPADTGTNPWVANDPFFMILNLAIGGYWPGSPDANSVFPKKMLVDYVRVFAWGGDPFVPAAQESAIQGYANRCIDVPGGSASDGARLQIWDCNAGTGQRWTTGSDGTIRALGKCMDVAWGSTVNGAVVQLASCNGGAAQQFVLNAAGDLVNPAANKCIDVKDWNSSNGGQLQLWDCAGTANQKWWRKAL